MITKLKHSECFKASTLGSWIVTNQLTVHSKGDTKQRTTCQQLQRKNAAGGAGQEESVLVS